MAGEGGALLEEETEEEERARESSFLSLQRDLLGMYIPVGCLATARGRNLGTLELGSQAHSSSPSSPRVARSEGGHLVRETKESSREQVQEGSNS